MAARSISTATISFGLVTIPVRVYPATKAAAGISFHLLHAKDGVRVKQQYVCPADGDVVPRSEMVRGFEYTKGEYATFTDEELKALDEKATQGIEIAEFLPGEAVDPVFFEKAYYLGPDRGGEKPYALLTTAMTEMKLLAVAKYAARGKDYLVLLRTASGRLVMQQLYHSDEVRPVSEVPAAEREVRDAELKLAKQLIEQIASERFEPGKYEDQVRARVKKAIDDKLEGKQTVAPAQEPAAGKVVDLMAALKASLGARQEPARQREPARATTRAAAQRTRSRSAGGSSHHKHRRAS